jgi:hypothetical protein
MTRAQITDPELEELADRAAPLDTLCGRAVRRLETRLAGVWQRGGDHDDKRR